MTRSGHYVSLCFHLKSIHLLPESKHHWSDSGVSWVRIWALRGREESSEPQAHRNAIVVESEAWWSDCSNGEVVERDRRDSDTKGFL